MGGIPKQDIIQTPEYKTPAIRTTPWPFFPAETASAPSPRRFHGSSQDLEDLVPFAGANWGSFHAKVKDVPPPFHFRFCFVQPTSAPLLGGVFRINHLGTSKTNTAPPLYPTPKGLEPRDGVRLLLVISAALSSLVSFTVDRGSEILQARPSSGGATNGRRSFGCGPQKGGLASAVGPFFFFGGGGVGWFCSCLVVCKNEVFCHHWVTWEVGQVRKW